MNTHTMHVCYTVSRDNDVPLRFDGGIIGFAIDEFPDNGGCREVTLYRSTGGKLIASMFFDAKHLSCPIRKAGTFSSAVDLINWLRHPQSGELDSTALKALKSASYQDHEISTAFGETVS